MESLYTHQPSPLSILQNWGAQVGIHVLSFNQVLSIGKENPRNHVAPTASDVYALSYTSGTTGNPKGMFGGNKRSASDPY